MDVAIVRGVSASLASCELTFLEREAFDVPRARAQHRAYVDALRALGLRVIELPPAEDHPDGCFVEDTAVVVDEVAVLTRIGTVARHGEEAAVAEALAAHRRLARIEAPAQIDGGDVLRMGRRVFVGRSRRTNEAGIRALRAHLEPHGYTVTGVRIGDCLHLKSGVSGIDDESVLINRSWVDPEPFAGLRLVDLPAEEPRGANVLVVRGTVLAADAFPRTIDRLSGLGARVRALDIGELMKAEAALTCMSLLLRDAPAAR